MAAPTGDCPCLRNYASRDFTTARDADLFMSRIRLSPDFEFVAMDGTEISRERYRCRKCGREWCCRIPSAPPYTWAPVFSTAAPPAPSPPAGDDIPMARPAFLEVDGRTRRALSGMTVLFPEGSSQDVDRVLRALHSWRPGLDEWGRRAGFAEVEAEIGPRIAFGTPLFEVFSRAWPADKINPAWREVHSGKTWRVVDLRGIRERLPNSRYGFKGEYFVVVVDPKKEVVVAFMNSEVAS